MKDEVDIWIKLCLFGIKQDLDHAVIFKHNNQAAGASSRPFL